MLTDVQGYPERSWAASDGEQYDLSSEVDPQEEGYPKIQFGENPSRRGTPDSIHNGDDSPVIEDGRSAQSSWTNPSYISSIPWGAQVQKRQFDRTSTPPIQPEDDYAGTTVAPSAESATSLHKQAAERRLSFQSSFPRHIPSPIAGHGTPPAVETQSRSTDSFRLEDSPLITSLNFPSPPEKSSQLSAYYDSRSQVTPPARRPVTPEQPTTPIMLSPETGRFQSSSKSYPSPVEAGFRSPSSRFDAGTTGRRSVSGPSLQLARTLDFDNNQTSTRLMQFSRDRSRSDSFGSTAEGLQSFSARKTAARMPDITEAALRPERYSAYGFEVPDFAVDDFDPLSPTAEGGICGGASGQPFRTHSQTHLEPGNPTPDLSLSELVSSPPSVDTGADLDIIQTTMVTPEGRLFPETYSSHDSGKQWVASSGVIGLGEGIAGGPQRDERGRRINLRRWKKADPLSAGISRTAVDVYTNVESEKQRPGFKKRFSQSVLNLLGETKKTHKNAEAIIQPLSKPIKKESRKSVTDLLGLSGKARRYDWNEPQDSQRARVNSKQRLNPFGRSESVPVDLSVVATTEPAWLPYLQRSHHNLPSQKTRKRASRLPASPSMPALSATLHSKLSPDLRIQDWLNTSQAALHDTRSSRYDFCAIAASDTVSNHTAGLRSPSMASRILTRRPDLRSETRAENSTSALGREAASAGDPATLRALPRRVSAHAPVVDAVAKERGLYPTALDSAVNLPASSPDHASEQKQPSKKRTSLSRFTSWLGFVNKNSTKYSTKESSPPEYVSSRGTTFAIQHRTQTTELDNSSRQSAPSPNPSPSITGGLEDRDFINAKKRRSGSDWLGSVGWRRWESAPQAASAIRRETHIVLLSSEHLPPPHINAQGFLQSTPNASSNSAPMGEPPLSSRFSSLGQMPIADSFLNAALLAPRMERDLSRLSERDEDIVGERWGPPASPMISTAIAGHRNQLAPKPAPPAFLDTSNSGLHSCVVPPSESRRRHSSKRDEFGQILSITSLSSLSTGLAEGEDQAATIQTVLASPIHENTPYPPPVVSRGVSLDLSALTDAEKSVIGFNTISRPVIAN